MSADMPSNPLHIMRINARELLRVPGATREIDAAIDASTLGVDDERITGPVAVDLDAVSSIDSIVVTGTVALPWSAPCRRCLTQVDGVAVVHVDEVYQDDVVAGDDAYVIEGDQIDLAPAVREYVVLELPDDALCRDDCASICPVCGIDRNASACSCDTTVRDDRWAALDQLDLGD